MASDFDNLPGHGEPLRLGNSPVNTEWDLAFTMLKNGGIAPYWVELSKEIDAATVALRERREQTRRYLIGHLRQIRDNGEREEVSVRDATHSGPRKTGFRLWPFRKPNVPPVQEHERQPSLPELETARLHSRNAYLEAAAELDKKILEFHSALPSDLWRLQRTRRTVEQTTHEFDAACPPISSDEWQTITSEDEKQPT